MSGDPFRLLGARVHEAGGIGRRAFAAFQARLRQGPVVWILPAHGIERPLPAGMPAELAERLILVTPAGQTDLLWSFEEALRSGAAGLAIVEPVSALSLTAGRRLQLAAEAGRTTGIVLIQDGAGSSAAETRWHCQPVTEGDSTRHEWRLTKNKRGTLGRWLIDWDGTSADFDLVSAAGERSGDSPPSG